MRLDIKLLIQELGGASLVAEICGIHRTAPYGWLRRDFVSSTNLAKIKTAHPNLILDNFFRIENDDEDRRRAGVP